MATLAPLPAACPCCDNRDLRPTGVQPQYQTEIPTKPLVRQFNIHFGKCEKCGAKVQGRHALQTSDAVGAAKHQLGPNAHALMAVANKQLGLSHGKISKLFEQLFGIKLSRSASCRSILRTGKKLAPAYEEIRQSVRGSPQVVSDETGWRIGGQSGWLHAFVGQNATCYDIDRRRDIGPAARLLGLDWTGMLVHDGWSVYRKLTKARHQQCLAHIKRRCIEMIEVARGGAVRFPRKVLELIDEAFAVRRAFRQDELTIDEQAILGLDLSCQLQEAAEGKFTNQANRRLAGHIARHMNQWFMFLIYPETDATNFRAEQAIRPAVVNRKVWGGNRTERGARAQSVITSVIQTCAQNTHDAFAFVHQTLTATPASPPKLALGE